jgi:hypothetical protein
MNILREVPCSITNAFPEVIYNEPENYLQAGPAVGYGDREGHPMPRASASRQGIFMLVVLGYMLF